MEGMNEEMKGTNGAGVYSKGIVVVLSRRVGKGCFLSRILSIYYLSIDNYRILHHVP